MDYEFFNYKTFNEKLNLKIAYKTLIAKEDSLELHQACIWGQIFEFAKSHMKLEIGFKQLMKNIYPLIEY